MCEALGRDPEGKDPIPFEPENRKFMDAYFDVLHRRLEADGVDFWVSRHRAGEAGLGAGVDTSWLCRT